MPESCQGVEYKENYLDYLVEYYSEELSPENAQYCFHIASNRTAVIYKEGTDYRQDDNIGVKQIPRCYGLMSSAEVLEAMGVLRVRNQPGLELFGQGVLVGFVDTGIDYTHPAFTEEDGSSRIIGIWDQTLEPMGTERSPLSMGYGVEYTRENINEALSSDNPWKMLRSRDTNGHGTFLAGVACGRENPSREFSGVAPLSLICVVKCKEAKDNLKEYFCMSPDTGCYAESDIALGIRYLWEQSLRLGMPLVICIGMGTNQGGHTRGGILGELLQEYGDYRGVFSVISTGNEANASHHYQSGAIAIGESVDVEIRVDEKEYGFTTELWTDATDLYSVGLISPEGEYTGKIEVRFGGKREISFLFANTVVYVEYLLNAYENGDECVRISIRNPGAGIWKIRVFNDNKYSSQFDLWLPITEFLQGETIFLRSNPDLTICDPGNNPGVITAGAYKTADRSIYPDSGRGFSRNNVIKPDFVSPGVNVYGPLPFLGNASMTEGEREEAARYGYRSGASIAAATTAGAVCLLAEWALVRGNDLSMDTERAKRYLIRGTDREGLTVPSRVWGNGILNLFAGFDILRPRG